MGRKFAAPFRVTGARKFSENRSASEDVSRNETSRPGQVALSNSRICRALLVGLIESKRGTKNKRTTLFIGKEEKMERGGGEGEEEERERKIERERGKKSKTKKGEEKGTEKDRKEDREIERMGKKGGERGERKRKRFGVYYNHRS